MTRIYIQREPSADGATLGCLFVDQVFQCFTLEDPIRELAGVPVEDWKIAGETAIPAGRYVVKLTMSRRFRCVLPLVLDVPGFRGIRVHAGNDAGDTEGCILVGRRRKSARVLESRLAFDALFARLARDEAAGIEVVIKNPAPSVVGEASPARVGEGVSL